jgi:hypothetical protein
MTDERPSARDESHWAKPVSGFHVGHEVPAEAVNLNVEGRRVAAMAGGFGKMWQKTYTIRLEGADVTPQEVVKVWKERFAAFWPKRNKFFGPQTPIAPGDVALLNLKTAGVKLSTGILVMYADDESFSFMLPEGGMFSGMNTFSAYTAPDGVTVAQVQALIRGQDPFYELSLTFGGHRIEDRMWLHVLQSLGLYFGVEARASLERVCLDRHRQWSQWRDIRKNAAIRSGVFMLTTPVRALKKPFRRLRTLA